MSKLIFNELVKFKSSKIKYSVLVLLVPVILMVFIYAVNPKYTILEWEEYLTSIQTFLNMIVCIVIFGIITAYIFGIEYETKTINVLLTYPICRTKLLIAKLLTIFLIIITSLIITFFISLLGGLFVKHEPLTFHIIANHFIDYLKISYMQFILITLVSALTIRSKNVLVPIIFIVAASFFNMILVNSTISIIYPWSIPLILTPHSFGGRTYTNYALGYTTLVVSLIIGTFFSIKNFFYTE